MKSKTLPTFQKRRVPNILVALGWYSQKIFDGIAVYAKEAGWALDYSLARHGKLPLGWNGDGIISILTDKPELLDLVERTTVPIVELADNPCPRQVSRVTTDNDAIGRIAAEHFVECGFEHICFVTPYLDGWPSSPRYKSFCAHLAAAGRQCHLLNWQASARELENRGKTYAQWLGDRVRELPRPLALFAPNDDNAYEVIQVLLNAGVHIPEEVAILGVDNETSLCEFAPVALSSIDSDLEGMGYAAAKQLHILMEGGAHLDEPLYIPPKKLIVRESSDIQAVENIHVANAIRFIRENYREAISVDYVAEQVPMSKSAFVRLFKFQTGRTVGDEIMRVRIEKAKELAIDSEYKAREIGDLCGFASEVSFCRAFKRETGETLLGFRKGHQNGSTH